MSLTEESAGAQAEAVSFEDARERLVNHPLYVELSTPERGQIFMKHHVFAVWDFFSLLKRLQREVSCLDVPWTPRGKSEHARFITEIVLAEECDEGVHGGYASHFELYLAAMDEVGADRGPIDGFLERLGTGQDPIDALEADDIPASVRTFVTHTLRVALDGEPFEVASSFCHGRENLLPDVLGGVQAGMGDTADSAPTFKHYLERHITLDHDEHGPLALKLLDALCEGDPARIQRADEVAISAIEARSGLWDGVREDIREHDA
ncbi:MAG: hypothetical protein QOK25_2059 [Thermoleophilaceae bacterium]|jgi:hypothetical protein|nr:hypothetical protein [Thermoleophilaceae bacterium]